MNVEYLHASKYGDGAMVAAEFQKQMAARGDVVAVHHIREVSPTELPPANLYVFSSPARLGKPIRGMRRFLKRMDLPAGTRYAILTTEVAPAPENVGLNFYALLSSTHVLRPRRLAVALDPRDGPVVSVR